MPNEVQTAGEAGWGDLDDGALLDAMGDRFDILVTVDKGLPQQQRIDVRPFAVIVLRARTNRLADLLPLVPALRSAMGALAAGQVREIVG